MSGDTYMPLDSVQMEPTHRWIRVKYDGQMIADSKSVMMLREAGSLPVYFFPKTDIRSEMLQQSSETSSTIFYDVQGASRSSQRAAYAYKAQAGVKGDLTNYVAFRWHEMDQWFEEEEEVFVHPRDPYKRIDAIPSSRHVQVRINGAIVADTHRPTLLFETRLPTRYYLPAEDVDMSYLSATATSSRCPYKGIASYWSATVADVTLTDVVWAYPDPIAECPKIKDLMCFFNEKVDIFVDGELQERPQTPWS